MTIATEAKSRPIIYTGAMVRALLALPPNNKTQTRRLNGLDDINAAPDNWLAPKTHGDGGWWFPAKNPPVYGLQTALVQCPYGVPGDRLWVRETCKAVEREADLRDGVQFAADGAFVSIANTKQAADDWIDLYHYRGKRGATVPPIHMPRWVSRISLEIIDIRVQRLLDCSEDDARAEGVEAVGLHPPSHVLAFRQLWDRIHGDGATYANPWVWAITFKRMA